MQVGKVPKHAEERNAIVTISVHEAITPIGTLAVLPIVAARFHIARSMAGTCKHVSGRSDHIIAAELCTALNRVLQQS